MTRSSDSGLPREPCGTEPRYEVFYLRVEARAGGFCWMIVKSGTPNPILMGPSIYPTDHAARLSGRAGLDKLLKDVNRW